MKHTKLTDFLISAFIILSFLMAGYFVFDSLYPSKLLVFDYKVIPIAKGDSKDLLPEFSPGAVVPLHLKGTRYTDKAPVIITHMIDVVTGSSVASWSSEYAGAAMVALPRTGKGPFDFVSYSQLVPSTCFSGIFYFERTYKYERNFIRNEDSYKMRTEQFRVSVPVHNDDTDKELIKRIIREMKQRGELK